MPQSVLSRLILGYRPLWNRQRKLAGIQLYAHNETSPSIDAAHLLRTLQQMWSASSPPLLLSARSHELLHDLLANAPVGAPWIEVRGDWLYQDPRLSAQVRAAHQRGLKLVWRGDVGQGPPADLARSFDNSLLSLNPQEVVQALQANTPTPPGSPPRPPSPAREGQMYENIASKALMEHCLDQKHALALAGWPSDDVLHQQRHKALQPAHATITRLLKAIESEQSLEAFEDILSEDPLLAYRFMTYTNSAALGLRTGIDSLRRGLVMMGYGSMQRWLAEQLPHASTDINLRPVRESMVMRAQLMRLLLDAGIENELRREVYLCGLFSQLDLLMREPLGNILHRLPLSERIHDAAVMETGPYAPPLQMATALETDDAAAIRRLSETHEMGLEAVNRALLRMLSELQVERHH